MLENGQQAIDIAANVGIDGATRVNINTTFTNRNTSLKRDTANNKRNTLPDLETGNNKNTAETRGGQPGNTKTCFL